ncbi:MAG TPA: LamG-like jellyroll fold domain-containing protein, partial [Bacillota bacterium]|nr:LamG-like jellyroll fold domain-containing protein [Bacillota bacterium]
EAVPSGMRVPVELEPRGSLFVLFRRPVGESAAVVQVNKDSEVLLSTAARPVASQAILGPRNTTNTFTMAGWVKPAVEIALPKEADAGVFIQLPRNDAVFPVHGTSVFSESGHACAGISAGRNGVCVYEHSGDYFAPVLVQAVMLTNWTHLAVVYQNGRPSLFVNGQRVHQGLASRFQVHSAVGADQNASFKGELSEFRDFAQALTEAEVLRLVATKPAAMFESPVPVITLTRTAKDGMEAEVSERGRYSVKMADGQVRSLEAVDLPEPLTLTGPWDVHFPPHRDVPEQIRLNELVSLAEHTNEAVKYFSGTAAYSRSFDLPANRLGKDKRVLLDLGRVETLAEVSLNGQNLGVFWKPPFIVDLTRAARPGTNNLEVRVTGTWRNRLIGDAKYPNGFPETGAGAASGGGRFKSYLTADIKPRPDDVLTAFGLIGPVRIQSAQRFLQPAEKH